MRRHFALLAEFVITFVPLFFLSLNRIADDNSNSGSVFFFCVLSIISAAGLICKSEHMPQMQKRSPCFFFVASIKVAYSIKFLMNFSCD